MIWLEIIPKKKKKTHTLSQAHMHPDGDMPRKRNT
jgi:hypothetical protein